MKAFARFGIAWLALAALPAAAHDFWLQPALYWAAPSTPVAFTLQVGHGPYRQRSPMSARRIGRLMR